MEQEGRPPGPAAREGHRHAAGQPGRRATNGTTPRAASGDCSRQRKGPWAQRQKEGLQVPLSFGRQGKQEELSCDSSRPGSPEERPVSLLQGGKPPEVHPGGCLIPDVRCIGGTH